MLKREAARHTSDLSITEANYDIAWAQLHDRYQNKRKIIMAVIDRFRNYAKCNGSSKAVKGLIDATKRCIRALELQGYVTTDFVEILFYHEIVTKLDVTVRDLWEHTIDNKDIPKLDKLCEFLERHSTALETKTMPRQEKIEKSSESAVYNTQTN